MTWLHNRLDEQNDPKSPTVPSRTVNTAFQPSTTHWVMGFYTFQLDCTEGQTAEVDVKCDSATTPTTIRGTAKLIVGDDGDSGSAPHITSQKQVVLLIPPGHYVKFVTSGSGASTIVQQEEFITS